jgi:anti-anti-sigma factor
MQFTHSREDLPGKVVLHFTGQLAQENIEQVSAELTPLIAGVGAVKLVIDMMNCDYINSRTVAHLAMWRQSMADQQGELVILQPQPQVMDVLHVVGLDQIIRFVNVMDEV